MSINFEELDYRPTPMGVLTLRRRRKPGSEVDVYEIKLGDEFLMSSAFTAAEIALADVGLASLQQAGLEVVVGGLGLGYTAQAVLKHSRVGALLVVDALPEVIEWHHAGLIPVGRELSADPRCRLVQGDFFALSASATGFDPRRARPPLRCHPGGHRPRPGQPAASQPRRFLQGRRIAPACCPSEAGRGVRTVVERSALRAGLRRCWARYSMPCRRMWSRSTISAATRRSATRCMSEPGSAQTARSDTRPSTSSPRRRRPMTSAGVPERQSRG